ncbi:hypothetical protein BJ085DRAFT_41276 [Dimargaris cristalligena]|uniref:Uncharacterized protein n=1 Tax=Dimargaris cristalligena TaxID=215637 RepID=A0A4P9ZSV4_9FUNG|nr:hypothetical protein BJ085DRAFT_41276 [Dimargaris cristalligena]|eukprot:RKP36573.1 hypothetical protein BJ085DRAFT_41276 [Dimargaris cristalligena]
MEDEGRPPTDSLRNHPSSNQNTTEPTTTKSLRGPPGTIQIPYVHPGPSAAGRSPGLPSFSEGLARSLPTRLPSRPPPNPPGHSPTDNIPRPLYSPSYLAPPMYAPHHRPSPGYSPHHHPMPYSPGPVSPLGPGTGASTSATAILPEWEECIHPHCPRPVPTTNINTNNTTTPTLTPTLLHLPLFFYLRAPYHLRIRPHRPPLARWREWWTKANGQWSISPFQLHHLVTDHPKHVLVSLANHANM